MTELKGKAHVFTLNSGQTFRILAREVKDVADSEISNEVKIAEKMGLILLTTIIPLDHKGAKEQATKKTGGAK